jgi:hypothetical protein
VTRASWRRENNKKRIRLQTIKATSGKKPPGTPSPKDTRPKPSPSPKTNRIYQSHTFELQMDNVGFVYSDGFGYQPPLIPKAKYMSPRHFSRPSPEYDKVRRERKSAKNRIHDRGHGQGRVYTQNRHCA